MSAESPLSTNEKLLISGAVVSANLVRQAVELSGVADPLVTIDTTAKIKAGSFEASAKTFDRLFDDAGLNLPHYLQVENSAISLAEKQELINESDVLMVLGGSTQRIYERWHEVGIAEQITERVQSGKMVGSGMSAGAMIWFAGGYSDSMQEEVEPGEHWDYMKSDGLGVFPQLVTAHHNDKDEHGRQRHKHFREFLLNTRAAGEWQQAIGLDTFAAVVSVSGLATVLNPAKHLSDVGEIHEPHVYMYDNSLRSIAISRYTHGDTFSLTMPA